MDTLKRKLRPSLSSSSRKKIKRNGLSDEGSVKIPVKAVSKGPSATVAATVGDLPWKPAHFQGIGEFGDETGGMAMLEEVEGVEVVYDNGVDGKVVEFRLSAPEPINEGTQKNKNSREVPGATVPLPLHFDSFDSTLLPAWSPYPLHPALLQSLHRRGFKTPTKIQQRALDVFLNVNLPSLHDGDNAVVGKNNENEKQPSESMRRDIIGIAETGSGKTLAFGLPILHHILTALSNHPLPTATGMSHEPAVVTPAAISRRSLKALILTPTRELALQVSEHLNACLDQLFAPQSRPDDSRKPEPKAPPPVSVAAIVGGMSAQKQRRILSRGVDVLVATPGRFWDLCGEEPTLAAELKSLQFLVLDEADRMVETGHFQELDNILRLTSRPPPNVDGEAITAQNPAWPEDLAYADVEIQEINDTLQTFVFSATMSKDLQRDLKRKRGGRKHRDTNSTTLEDLLMRLDFRDPDPVIIDLSPEGGRVEGLQESKIECLTADKDVYMYYFLLRHPGRSLVFLSSIDGIRRLTPLLQLLRLNVWPLHSGLQQKQRLKNLDRFKSDPNSVLLATDVAARGLDVPAVDHVIHYQIPRTADAYVHRNGRTARAMRNGFGLVLCAPEERRVFRDVLSGLERDKDDIPELIVEHHLVDKLKARVQLAREIDARTHRFKKERHDRSWMRETANAMEIELPSDLESDGSEDVPKASGKKDVDRKLAALKAQLNDALAQPLIARGVSTRYITSGTRAIVDDMLQGQNHDTLLGLKRMGAGSGVVRQKTQKKKQAQRIKKAVDVEPE